MVSNEEARVKDCPQVGIATIVWQSPGSEAGVSGLIFFAQTGSAHPRLVAPRGLS